MFTLFSRLFLYLFFMWAIRSLVCLEPKGLSKSPSLSWMMVKGEDHSVSPWAHWAWLLMFSPNLKFNPWPFTIPIYVLFHQSADVYCPQEVLHFIHNAGWRNSAQVRLHKIDDPLFSVIYWSLYLVGNGYSGRKPSLSLYTVFVAFNCSSKHSDWISLLYCLWPLAGRNSLGQSS